MPPVFESPDPGLYELRDEHLEPRFLAARRASSPEAWDAVAPPIGPPGLGLREVRVLTRDWCARLAEEVERIEAFHARHGIALERPNSMNAYGLVLDRVGFAPALRALVVRELRPLAAHAFAAHGGATLDDHHGFVVDYARGKDEELGFHVDDSEVTLNLCLAGDFVGSELYVRGERCDLHRDTPARPDEARELEHEPGVAILHAGKQRHGVRPLEHGRRRSLIVWCRSTAVRAAPRAGGCPPWCGIARRRADA